ncbi:class I SAM-dependent methyltransferase [Haliangium sp.]|uniref:class I SAM-dependent methyltransferase n=1 Tax=Haliangium sp. TaxID=2663208 RepID=UPI003D0D6941
MSERPAASGVASAGADRAYWERFAAHYDRSLGLLRRPLPRMLELVGEAVGGAERVLEVAAGTGVVTTSLARAAKQVVATDYAAAMVEKLEAQVKSRGLANVRCEQADLYALPYEPGSFDAVVAANVLHLVPDLPGALDALRRMMKPGGVLVVPTFCHDQTRLSWLVSRLLALTGFPGRRRFTVDSLTRALAAAGLAIGRTETLPGLLPIGYVDGVFGAA